jgi:hypothetical protein
MTYATPAATDKAATHTTPSGPPDVSAHLDALEREALAADEPSLAAQIEEVEREIRQRVRLYPQMIAKGRLKPDTAGRKLTALRHAHTTLMWLAAHQDWIRAEAKRRAAHARDMRELATIKAAPEVQAVLAALPGAVVTRTYDSGTHSAEPSHTQQQGQE